MLELRHQTRAQFLARVRARYRDARGADALALASRVLDWIDAGDVSDAEVRAAFGATAAQWSQIKARMVTLRAARRTAQEASGE